MNKNTARPNSINLNSKLKAMPSVCMCCVCVSLCVCPSLCPSPSLSPRAKPGFFFLPES